MFLLDLTCLAFSATLSAMPGAIHSGARVQTDSTQQLLTVADLSHMTTFWSTFMKEPLSVRDTGRKQNKKPLTVSLDLAKAGHPTVPLGNVVNMVAMAAKYPSVAADLKKANLTPEQWETLRMALYTATVADQGVKSVGEAAAPAPSSVLGQNIAFLNSHKKEYDALVATGMWFPQMDGSSQMGGGNSSDLQP